jgi:hypothetical protein
MRASCLPGRTEASHSVTERRPARGVLGDHEQATDSRIGPCARGDADGAVRGTAYALRTTVTS